MGKLYINPITQLLPQTITNKSLIVIGCLPAGYILTTLYSKALNTWSMGTPKSNPNYKSMIHFYNSANLPDYMLYFSDRWTLPLTDLDIVLMSRYTLSKRLYLEQGSSASLYTKNIKARGVL